MGAFLPRTSSSCFEREVLFQRNQIILAADRRYLENVSGMSQNVWVMNYVDLFAGCGGLSLGIERAGGKLLLAVEKSPMAARTFHHNLVGDAANAHDWDRYVDSTIDEQFDGKVLVRPLSDLLERDDLVKRLADSSLDLIVGGPPCQGFSLAGRRDVDDVRNKLAWEYLELVERTSPKAVVIENVVGMNQKFNTQEESSFQQLQQALAEIGSGYVVQGVLVNAMHFGAPQHRPRLMILGLRNDIASAGGITGSGDIWKSHFLGDDTDLPDLAPVPTTRSESVRTVGDAVRDLSRNWTPKRSSKNASYVKDLTSSTWGHRTSSGTSLLNHVPRKHSEKTVDRFRFYQFLSANDLDQRLLSRAAGLEPEESRILIKNALRDAPTPAEAPDGTVIARDLEGLVAEAMRLLTKKHSQRVLAAEKPARTVVTLPDDYVHPIEPRIFTVREMARFQGFPEGFEFLGKETTGAHRRRVEVPQYSQVGNAVSPWLSYAVGQKISSILEG